MLTADGESATGVRQSGIVSPSISSTLVLIGTNKSSLSHSKDAFSSLETKEKSRRNQNRVSLKVYRCMIGILKECQVSFLNNLNKRSNITNFSK